MLLVVLLVLGLLAALGAKSMLAPLPKTRSVPQATEFHVHRAAARLTELLGDERPHPTDSAANDAVRERLLYQLSEMGLKPQVHEAQACNENLKARNVNCARVRNVVATIGPATGKHLLLAAHYDSTPVGPGAADAGAGVATLLEVAYLLKDRPLERPVTFLFDEGEEVGLIGARAFLADPLSRQVDSLINLEARGVTGSVNMFETSVPNAAAVGVYNRAVKTPVASSLSTDVYRLIPNSTDVTTFASRGWLTLNLAIVGNETRYHSAGDSIAALDLRSLQMMGDQTLALATELAAGTPSASGGNRIFMDLLGTELIALPLFGGLALLVALILGLGWIAWRRGSLGRAAVTVVAALALAALIAWVMQAIVGLLRPGTYWRAFPLAAYLAAYAVAIGASLAMLATLGRALDADRLRAAFWLIFVLIGALLATVAPGGIIYFLFPALIVLIGMATTGRSNRSTERYAALAAILLLYLTYGVMLGMLELLSTDGPIWLFAPLGALLVLPLLIEAKPLIDNLSGKTAVAVSAVATVAAWAVVAWMPAYSADRQQRLTIAHVTDAAAKRAFWSVVNDGAPVPKAFEAAGTWTRGKLPHSDSKRWLAAAPAAAGIAPPALQLLSATTAPGGRRVSVRLAANGAHGIALVGPKDAAIRAAGTAGFVRPIRGGDDDDRYAVRCSGRSCDGLVLDLFIGKAAPVEFVLVGWRPGLPPAGAALTQARPRFARPQYSADETIAMTRVRL